MKNLLAVAVGIALLTALTGSVVAAETMTIKGEAACPKCELKETDKCGCAIKVKEGDKDVTYYAKDNQVAKEFHSSICKAPAKVVATGKVSEKDGKKMISLTDIKLDK